MYETRSGRGGPGGGSRVRLAPWAEGDLDLLRQANAPELMTHLGGPETEERLRERHARYVALSDTGPGRMLSVSLPTGEPAGVVGYWEREWRGEVVWETGWTVLPAFQGRGIATAAALAVAALAAAEGTHRYLHAYPSTANLASNATCRKAGFTLLGPCDLEYPPGHPVRCNDWRRTLAAG
ncbi:N-acetyltransferase [Streptomyces hoynatensis]|uniref:N-acetyltransferase n=1 Tax=Streptomyces hoynatensis TaxID=1141874 RepID=A0A3A9YUR9_9ACTN|nr:N-acetyltransferase [Streptomyces hoynatensis]